MRFKSVVFLFIFLITFSLIKAAEFKTGQTVDVKGDVKEDLYIGAGQVNVSGNINGDANIASGDIVFKSRLTGDAQLAAGKVQAEIGGADDVRIMGGQVTATIKNSGDVFLMGGETNLLAASDIGGDLYIMGGKATFEGNVRGNVHVWGGDVTLKGTIGGTLDVRGENTKIFSKVNGSSRLSSTALSIQPDARFNGPVAYWSDGKTDFHNSLKSGTATYDPSLRGEREDYKWGKHWYWLGLLIPASAALTIFLFVFLMPALVRESSEKLLSAPVSTLGYGVLYYLTLPVFAILFFITLIGFPIGLLLGAVHGFSIAFARPLTSAIIAAAVAKKYNKTWSRWMLGLAGFGIYIGLSFLFMIPFAGMVVNILVVLSTMGAMVQVLYERYRATKA